MSDHTFITYSEVVGYKPRSEELTQLIASLDKKSSFAHLAIINNLLALFPIHFDESKYVDVQTLLCTNLLDPNLYEKLRKFVGNISLIDRPIFLRQQILLLMKRILLEASDNGKINPDKSREERNLLGKICFMMSDFMVSEEQERKSNSDNPVADGESERVLSELFVQLLPVTELMNPPEITNSLVRTQEYIQISNEHFEEIFEGQSISSFFLSATGISIERFLQMIVGIYATLIVKDLSELLENPANFNISKSSHFSNLDFSQKEVDSFYDLTAKTFEELVDEMDNSPLRQGLQIQYDFTVFRKYPLFHLSEDVLTSVDFSFLTEKVSTGLYHTILNSLLDANANLLDANANLQSFFQHWGYVFERYVNAIFRAIYPEFYQRFHPNSFFDTKPEKEAFDGIIEYPKSLIVMEYKAGLLNTKAKYGGDANLLLDEMSKRFGCSTKDGAIKQLARKIELLFNSNHTARLEVRNLPFPNIRNVYPVVIANDLSLEFGLAHWRLRGWFEEEIKTKNLDTIVSVWPLMVLSIEDLEILAPYLEAEDFTLLDFVQYYSRLEYVRFSWFLIREHWYEPMTSLRDVFSKFRKDRNIEFRRNQKVQKKWENFMDKVMSSFKSADLHDEISPDKSN